ncbi:MAG: hypothetical protein HN742_01680 [Lentisphaerae bacterium]|nr:hypothetical protein [Lentisphaerota bacterium]MBT4814283.1 hypothetical protein [Lentisphaerota bacterium]MBT5612317.1 hypothetical protein [Lentisphaerota bacterium]MBT7056621.1 hypothetical protein [Lentisphaerota bacterium]MBT7840546.1 hypothetical protein [Lentisphaerota bacterium]
MMNRRVFPRSSLTCASAGAVSAGQSVERGPLPYDNTHPVWCDNDWNNNSVDW